MKLYTHPMSQHSRRVRMLCHEMGLSPQEVMVAVQEGANRNEDFLQINPAGQVPVLVDGDLTLAESHVIMKHLAQKHGGDVFYPAADRQKIDQWLDWTHGTLNPVVQTIAIERFMRGDDADEALIENCHQRIKVALSGYEAGFDFDGLNLADFAIGSTLALYQMVGGSLDENGKAARRFAKLAERPSFAETAPQM